MMLDENLSALSWRVGRWAGQRCLPRHAKSQHHIEPPLSHVVTVTASGWISNQFGYSTQHLKDMKRSTYNRFMLDLPHGIHTYLGRDSSVQPSSAEE